MSKVFCNLCGDDIDPNHSGCGRDDCPHKDSEVKTENVPGFEEVLKVEKKEIKPKKVDKFGDWEEYGRQVDAGENPTRPQPLPPWKKR